MNKEFKRTAQSWTEQDEQTLVRMWQEGTILPEISEVIGKTPYAIRGFIGRNRERLGLEARPYNYRQGRKPKSDEPKQLTNMDKLWHGPVPCKHWIVTKSWSKVNGSV